MGFKELDEWFDSGLTLPIKGKTYRIESVDAATGVWCQRMFSAGVKAASGGELDADALASIQFDDDEEVDLYQRIMGPTYTQMLEDELPWEWIKHAGITALFWVVNGKDMAEEYWNAGGSPEARRPEPQDHKAPARQGRQASRGSSKSPKKAKGRVSPGASSSSTGD